MHAGPEDSASKPEAPARRDRAAPRWAPGQDGTAGADGEARDHGGVAARVALSSARRVARRAGEADGHDLHDLAHRPGVPEDLRQTAGASALAVEKAIQSFQRAIGAADDEPSTQAARLAFEKRAMGIVAEHQEIHIALAALAPPPAPSKHRR